MALHITVSNFSKAKVLLRLTGEPSLTPRPGSPPGFLGGQVTVTGRKGTLLAGNSTVAYANAERLLVLTEDLEWAQLKSTY
jgi:hypothetical protein